MRLIPFFFLFTMYCKGLLAQEQETYIVKAGNSIADVVPLDKIYYYPQFISGTVLFKDGRISTARLNHNLLLGEFQFIDPKRDTLSLAEEEALTYILISTDSFYFDKCYLQLLASGNKCKLVKRIFFQQLTQNKGAYDMATSTSAVTNLNGFNVDFKYRLKLSSELVLLKSTVYLLSGKNNQFVPANKKNIVKLFPKSAKTIDAYLAANTVNFNRQEDLTRLVNAIKEDN